MKEYKTTSGYIVDVAGILLIVKGEKLYSEYYLESIPTERETKKGRVALDIVPVPKEQAKYILTVAKFINDRTHNDWNQFYEIVTQHPEVRGYMKVTSRGGGCWEEVWIFPIGVYSGGNRPDINKLQLEESLLIDLL